MITITNDCIGLPYKQLSFLILKKVVCYANFPLWNEAATISYDQVGSQIIYSIYNDNEINDNDN